MYKHASLALHFFLNLRTQQNNVLDKNMGRTIVKTIRARENLQPAKDHLGFGGLS
jgi:hypothetical protein